MAVSDGEILSCVYEFVLPSGLIFQNKFTWQYEGTSHGETGVVDVLVAWGEDFYELMAGQMASAVDAFACYVDEIRWDDVESEWYIYRTIGQNVGSVTFTNTSEKLPLQCAPCIVGQTLKPKSRGRKWIPFFCEDQQSSSTWVSACMTALGNALLEYLATHTFETGKNLVPGVASIRWKEFLPFVSGLVNNNVFTQRRRTPGVGA